MPKFMKLYESTKKKFVTEQTKLNENLNLELLSSLDIQDVDTLKLSLDLEEVLNSSDLILVSSSAFGEGAKGETDYNTFVSYITDNADHIADLENDQLAIPERYSLFLQEVNDISYVSLTDEKSYDLDEHSVLIFNKQEFVELVSSLGI